ncbi:F0F1 ATP synthase subunit epsilon [Pimelobacter simplex]|uniref:ATP synthase epsilon chain n=1 Tax=Nocardioides simplex TaxID=2045 RepID=A0A0A1DKJ3_NOCSI|nr:F0F1 ATP synthase subunit epsilon [Pimelobacter simplex]AIY17073.1 ATP synthase epsilon chain [Pimelobacter simplex]MCG8151793.1 F0F1 ATP synthase subunit epsilon [Pimelobacter simplex]GEB13031.1 ATP synthase epsilon chain [Pimelobacter simplex]SFM50555.1 F-type H+-transporting ATPase subunit epsilon [Pimelobacter simplex]
MAESAASTLHVELVAADRTVWSGEASMVIARTLEGDIGVLRGHAPTLSLLSASVVEIQVEGTNQLLVAALDGGFLSVANDRVSILAERVERGEDIEVSQAQVDLEEAKRLLDSSDEAEQRVRHAEARIRAAEKVSGKVS